MKAVLSLKGIAKVLSKPFPFYLISPFLTLRPYSCSFLQGAKFRDVCVSMNVHTHALTQRTSLQIYICVHVPGPFLEDTGETVCGVGLGTDNQE